MKVTKWELWREAAIGVDESLEAAAIAAARGARRIALIVSDDDKLIAILTDGDLRRAHLSGAKKEDPALKYAMRRPIAAETGLASASYARMLTERNIYHLPVVDGDGRVVDIFVRELPNLDADSNWAVIMAGGFGKRLSPLTDGKPKPVLPVGGVPIIERIIVSLVEAGVTRIVVSVFHMADQIRAFCGDGSKWGATITYIQEDRPCGTAGALALLDERPKGNLIVINGDILTNMPFDSLLHFHQEQGHSATVCVYEQKYEVQYGVITFDGPYVAEIHEKPTHSYFISAGIYVLAASMIDLVPKDCYFDMPALLHKMVSRNIRPAAFSIRETWVDIGTMKDFERAQNLFAAGGDLALDALK